ncbi:MAG: hypothetical protein AMXMBFR84_08590 [Candidatus Hydrogenedentota bacterium]
MRELDKENASALVDFLHAADGLKSVERASYLSDQSRHENPAEHTWHACLLALLLHPHMGQPVDLGHTLLMLLVHDLVEVYAGDTYAYDAAGQCDQADRERQAADRLFGLLPDTHRERLRALWHEFEAQATPEARFARSVDMAHGFAQNLFSGGRSWRERGVTETMARAYNRPAQRMDPALAMVYDVLLERARGLWHQAEIEGMDE